MNGASLQPAASAALDDLRALRGSLYPLCVRQASPDDVTTFADRTISARNHGRLATVDGRLRWEASVLAPRTIADRVTFAAETLLGSPVAQRITACPAEDCGWLFINASGRRRWCSMASCGNRAKVRAFAQRTGAG